MPLPRSSRWKRILTGAETTKVTLASKRRVIEMLVRRLEELRETKQSDRRRESTE
jgi:hypothetical protein